MIGKATHDYWWEGGVYYRRPLAGGPIEYWTGKQWAIAEQQAA